jgi:hypothetical protein
MAYPTEDLLQDLCKFNLSGFLSHGITHQFFLGFPYNIVSDVPRFLDWIKKQVHSSAKYVTRY